MKFNKVLVKMHLSTTRKEYRHRHMDKKTLLHFLFLSTLFYACILSFHKYFTILFTLQACFSKIDYDKGKVYINKGCTIDTDCVNREKQNVYNCYSQDGPRSCFFCCLDDLCNDLRLGSKYSQDRMSFLKHLKDSDDLISRPKDREAVRDFSQNLYTVLLLHLNQIQNVIQVSFPIQFSSVNLSLIRIW